MPAVLNQGQGSTGGGGILAHISSQAAGGMNVSVGGAGASGGPPHGIHFERYQPNSVVKGALAAGR